MLLILYCLYEFWAVPDSVACGKATLHLVLAFCHPLQHLVCCKVLFDHMFFENKTAKKTKNAILKKNY